MVLQTLPCPQQGSPSGCPTEDHCSLPLRPCACPSTSESKPVTRHSPVHGPARAGLTEAGPWETGKASNAYPL